MVAEYSPHEEGYLDFELLAQRVKDGTFAAPVNMLFVDARGEAARVVLGISGKPKIMH
jgi:hypothetical protein